MSMWLSYAKLSPSTFDQVRKEPTLVETLFFESDLAAPADFDAKKDVFGEDYRSISAVIEAMGEAGAADETLNQALGDGGEPVEYDFCYGTGFGFAPSVVQKLAKELSRDPDGFGIAEFFQLAAKEGKGIVGGVS